MTIISLHLPKTAGSSFRRALVDHFGQGYRDDYADGGLSRPRHEREEAARSAGPELLKTGLGDVDCVHGHFLPIKYLPLADHEQLTFITWMRDPVARMVSHYDYWQQTYDEKSSMPHHRMVIEQGWTLEQFCLSEDFRNVYAQYLHEFPLERFAFIGISEHYREDLRDFSSRYLSGQLQYHRNNVTSGEKFSRLLSPALLQRVREHHAEDMGLYRYALELRKSRYQRTAAAR